MENYAEQRVKSKIEKTISVAFKVFVMILAAIAFVLLIGYGVMLLWNWLIPELFGLPALAYWQSVGLLVLAKVFFGGLGDGPPSRGKRRSKGYFKNRMKKKCDNDFSRWKHYDEFWQAEGEKAYNDYLKRHKNENL